MVPNIIKFIGDKTMSTIKVDALVIGAGFSGMYQLLCLRDKLNLNVAVIERGSEVGGTWYWNRYPGARCDSESHAYQYYFSEELAKEWEWSERFPGHAEIRRYMNHVADKFNLRDNIRFNTVITSAHYIDALNVWRATTDAGDVYEAKFLITAVGCLSTANVPKIVGLNTFKGQWYHTGQWPHEGVDFSGKRVGVIGTGSTGIQVIPVVAQTAEHLTVFQRTANYSIPARNAPLTDEFKQYIHDHYEEIRNVTRTNTNGQAFRIENRSALETSPEDRLAIFEAAWEKGGFQFRGSFNDVLSDKSANDTAAEFIIRKIREKVTNPVTAAVLTDIDHPFAAKRPPIDTNYFETYNRDNVTLVDLKSTPIECITARGIQTSGTEYELDIIIFATGYDAMTGPVLKLNIEGEHGLPLAQAWSAGPRNYLGLQVPGFPNMFTITGPGSPSVLTNMPVAIEQHVDWITQCIADMQKQGFKKIEATEVATANWLEHVNAAANKTLLPLAKHSWYLGANVPGKPQVFMPYAAGMGLYREECEAIANDSYAGFVRS
jgi:cation diffusion facilitator CzcD-associated flavoprotein CzcO